VAFRRWLEWINRQGSPRLNAATLLGIGSPCLDDWTRRWKSGRREAEVRGRPAAQGSDDTLAKAIDLFNNLGPATSVATLMGLCHDLGRNEAAKVLDELRRECCEDHYATVTALQWMHPGTVWAMDHTRAPGAIDDFFPYVLLVRDLASHFQVGAMPQRSPTCRAVADALVYLFKQYGAPLVLKFDNHGAFTGREVQEVLAQYGVLPLVSPPYLPQYNGSVEAGAGQFKTRAHILSAQMNHPGRWTANIVEGARILANQTLRPWGKDGPTPEERWKSRKRLDDRERERLWRDYEARLAEYERNPPRWPANEGGSFFRISQKTTAENHVTGKDEAAATRTLAPWAQRINAMPGHRRPALPPAMPLRVAAKRRNRDRKYGIDSHISTGQTRESAVQYQRLKRRCLTDSLVESELLIIRKRRIPLPIKRLKRLKIS